MSAFRQVDKVKWIYFFQFLIQFTVLNSYFPPLKGEYHEGSVFLFLLKREAVHGGERWNFYPQSTIYDFLNFYFRWKP
jgi:hypothetical protein